jgi:hypothetical protein
VVTTSIIAVLRQDTLSTVALVKLAMRLRKRVAAGNMIEHHICLHPRSIVGRDEYVAL